MTVHIHLDEVMLKRKIKLGALAEQVGITQANLSILKSGRAKAIRFSTLSALCQALQCQPGELISFSNEPKQNQTPIITVY